MWRRAKDWLAWLRAPDTPPRTRTQKLLKHYVRVLLFVGRLEVLGRLQLRAQALTFQTLLAIVPLLAVFFAIFKGFGGLERVRAQLETLIIENLSGSPELRDTLSSYLTQFIDNIHTGAMGAVSVVILIYSVLGLLQQIEDSFNAIFGVKKGRPWNIRVILYWTALTLGPLLLGASLALTAALQTATFSRIVESLGVVGSFLVSIVPLAVTWLAFTALYMVVPNARVHLSSALSAALIAGSGWNVAKWLYAVYAKNNVTMQNIYGTMAAVPLFILWMFVSWLLVLFGAQLAFAFQHAATYREEDEAARASHAARERSACRLFLEIARDFYAGRPPTEPERAAAALGIPRRLIEQIAAQLQAGGFLRAVEHEEGYVPARDLAAVTVNDIIEHMRAGTGANLELVSDEPRKFLDELFRDLDHERAKVAGTVSFRELAARFAEAPLARPAAALEVAVLSEGEEAGERPAPQPRDAH